MDFLSQMDLSPAKWSYIGRSRWLIAPLPFPKARATAPP
jgi:hypothetical protein